MLGHAGNHRRHDFWVSKNTLRQKATRLAEVIWKNLEALGDGGQKTA